jgi:hypothetical protein
MFWIQLNKYKKGAARFININNNAVKDKKRLNL